MNDILLIHHYWSFEQQIGEKWDLVVPTNLVYLNPDVTPELPNYE